MKNFKHILFTKSITIASVSETWEVPDSIHHSLIKQDLEHNLGYKWFGAGRPKVKENGKWTQGGGHAVLVNMAHMDATKIKEIDVPEPLCGRLSSVVWVKAIPKVKCAINILIIVGIYFQPNHKVKSMLNDHLAMNFHYLKSKYKSVNFLFLGDFNEFSPNLMLLQATSLRQLVHYPTCFPGGSCIDLILTDIGGHYQPPAALPGLLPDPGTGGAQSDHVINILLPKNSCQLNSSRTSKTIKLRKITGNALEAMGNFFYKHDWKEVLNEDSSDMKVQKYKETVNIMLDACAPEQEMKICLDEPIWMTAKLKAEIRKRNRELSKNGKTEKWRQLLKKCRRMTRNSKKQINEKFTSDMLNSDPKTWMMKMKKLGRAHHEIEKGGWKFENEEKSDMELTEDMATYFQSISNHLTPIDRNMFEITPKNAPFVSEVPCVAEDYEIYELIKGAKKTFSVPGDIPSKILVEMMPAFVLPINSIIKSAVQTGVYPEDFKLETVIPLPKVYPPAGFDDIRPISLTETTSKMLELFLLKGTATVKGLLYYVRQYFSPDQYALPGHSCSHALISLIDFMLKNTDKCDPPKAVVTLLADWSKAFNLVNHNICIRILILLKVPSWLIRLLVSYLENRRIVLKFRGCRSSGRVMKGSSPQGTLIGVILYILYINPIAFPGEITLQVHHLVTEYWKKLDAVPDIIPTEETLEEQLNTAKYMDDASVQEVVDLKTSLATNRDRSGPLPWWESSGKVLPMKNTLLQREVERIKDISDSREMILNAKKTFIFTVNFTENHQFKPLITIPGQPEPLQVVQETKLLGYWLDTSMTPTTHVKYITSIAYKRLWAVSRLKSNGVAQKDIIKFFNFKVRSVLESSCPVFFTMLSEKDLVMLERPVKILVKILQGKDYKDYETGLAAFNHLGLTSMKQRLKKLTLAWALKAASDKKFSALLPLNPPGPYNLRPNELYHVPLARTERYRNSPLVALPRMLNHYYSSLPAEVLLHPAAGLLLPQAVLTRLALLPAPHKD